MISTLLLGTELLLLCYCLYSIGHEQGSNQERAKAKSIYDYALTIQEEYENESAAKRNSKDNS
jgi:hypothetical protein